MDPFVFELPRIGCGQLAEIPPAPTTGSEELRGEEDEWTHRREQGDQDPGGEQFSIGRERGALEDQFGSPRRGEDRGKPGDDETKCETRTHHEFESPGVIRVRRREAQGKASHAANPSATASLATSPSEGTSPKACSVSRAQRRISPDGLHPTGRGFPREGLGAITPFGDPRLPLTTRSSTPELPQEHGHPVSHVFDRATILGPGKVEAVVAKRQARSPARSAHEGTF